MSKYKKTFEDFLSFAENQLGIKFLQWQKDVLQKIYEGRPIYYKPARGIGVTTSEKAVLLLAEFKKENEL